MSCPRVLGPLPPHIHSSPSAQVGFSLELVVSPSRPWPCMSPTPVLQNSQELCPSGDGQERRHWDPLCLISGSGVVHVGCPRWMLPWAALGGTGPELVAVSLRDSPLLTSLSSGAKYINSFSAPGTKGNSVCPETQNTEWESTMWQRSPFHATPGVLTGSATTQSSLSYPCGIFHGLNVCLYLSNNVLLAFPVSCPKSSREQGGEYINI